MELLERQKERLLPQLSNEIKADEAKVQALEAEIGRVYRGTISSGRAGIQRSENGDEATLWGAYVQVRHAPRN